MRSILSLLKAPAGLLLLCACAAAQSPQELAAKAGQALRDKDYSTAETAYERLLQAVPNVAELHSNHGMACYFQDKFDCAEQAFSRALELKQELFLPNFLLGQILLKRGEYEAAYPLAERAVKDQPVQKHVRDVYAAILIGLERYNQAIATYEGSLEIDVSDADTYYALGQVYLEAGQKSISKLAEYEGLNFGQLFAAERNAPAEETLTRGNEPAVAAEKALALNAFKDALTSGVKVRGARIGYAKLLIADKDWESAQSTLQAELEDDPWSYEAKYQLARAALGQSDVHHAVEHLDQAVQIRPEFFDPLPKPHLRLAEEGLNPEQASRQPSAAAESFGAALVLSWLYAERGDASRSRQWQERAEKIRDGLIGKLQRKMPNGAHVGRKAAQTGFDLLRKKRYEFGIDLLLSLAHNGGAPAEITLEIARALYRTQGYKELVKLLDGGSSEPELTYLIACGYRQLALEQFQTMVALDPDSARAHQVLGEALFAQEMYVDAAQEYELATGLEPNNPELHFLRGNSYYKQMFFPAAVEAFERAIELDPQHAEAHLMLGDSLVQMGTNERAVTELKKSLDLSPDLEDVYVLLGKAYRALGEFELALANLEKGASQDKDGSIHYQIAMLYRRLKQTDKTREALNKSQRLREKSRKQ